MLSLDFDPGVAQVAAAALLAWLQKNRLHAIPVADIETGMLEAGEELADFFYREDDEETHFPGFVHRPDEDINQVLLNELLLEGLKNAADKHIAAAHYVLALLSNPGDDEPEAGSDYWYQQAREGKVLTGFALEFAQTSEQRLARNEKYAFHLQAAALLGHANALLDRAEQFSDPAFFEHNIAEIEIDRDPAEIADIASRLGRSKDAKKWQLFAAQTGDIGAMMDFVAEYADSDLEQSWTLVYLSDLMGADLRQSKHHAINGDGSLYDDDVDGPAYVGGWDGVDLAPMSAETDAAARTLAGTLFATINENRAD